MNNLNRKSINKGYCMDRSGHIIERPKAVQEVAPKKASTMADFLRSDMSARKRIYMDALAKSVKEQQDLIDEASRPSHA